MPERQIRAQQAHSAEKARDTTLDDENRTCTMRNERDTDRTCILVTVLCDQPEAFASDLGDNQSCYMLVNGVNLLVCDLGCVYVLVCCRRSQVYTFSSPPTVIEAPRIRVSPPRSAEGVKKPVPDSPLQPVDRNLSITDDSGTECELDSSQTTAASVFAARLSSCSSDNRKLVGATTSRLSPVPQSVRRSSLREIPEDEIRRSGVSSNI